jgi:VWFA-related protein
MKGVVFPLRYLIPTVCLLAILSAPLIGQQQGPIRAGASTVAVYATVTDSTGRLVPNLTKDDFEVFDNGKLQPLTVFENEVQQITIVVMLDHSGSMKENYPLVAAGASEFVRKLLPNDKARIGSFAKEIRIDPEDFTSDRRALVDLLHGDQPIEGPTPLWNAANKAMAALNGQDGRKVVLLFTDGQDDPGPGNNFSRTHNTSFMDVVERATRDDMMIYAIGLESRNNYGRPQAPVGSVGGMGGFGGGFGSGGLTQRPDPSLPKIAEETGGGYFELTRADDLRTTFARVADELHQQYALGFEPMKLDGKVHKLEVKLKAKGMKARARQNYLAAKQQPSS